MKKLFSFLFSTMFLFLCVLSFPSFVKAASSDYYIDFDSGDNHYHFVLNNYDYLFTNNGQYSCMFLTNSSSHSNYCLLFSHSSFSLSIYENNNLIRSWNSYDMSSYHYILFVGSDFGYTHSNFISNVPFPVFFDYDAFQNFQSTGNIDPDSIYNPSIFYSSEFDGSITVDNVTVTNETRYSQDLTYSVSFLGSTLVNKFSSTVFNSILGLGFDTYYNLQVPSYTFLQNTASGINDFDSWYSNNLTKSQLTVCDSYLSYTAYMPDYLVPDLGSVNNRQLIIANLSDITSDIYGVSLTDTEQKLFDVLCYVQSVGVRSKWLLSDIFGYGSLRVINIGPTLLNGRAINNFGFNGSLYTDDKNSYIVDIDDISDTDFNNSLTVVNSNDNTTIWYPDQTLINYNYTIYYDTYNYLPATDQDGVYNVYVTNYKDFVTETIINNSDEILKNYEFNFGDLNISSAVSSALNNISAVFDDNVDSDQTQSLLSGIVGAFPSDLFAIVIGFLAASIIIGVIMKVISH